MDYTNEDERFMRMALREAEKAFDEKEIPIGCVIVKDGVVIGKGHNQIEMLKDATAHAEILSIGTAASSLENWRLDGCTLYVTLEPCPMCAGAIVQARMDRLVIGTMSPKAGCAGSILNLMDVPQFNHQVPVTKGVCGDECSRMLTEFFAELRKKK